MGYSLPEGIKTSEAYIKMSPDCSLFDLCESVSVDGSTSLSSSEAKHRSPDCSFFELCVSVSVDCSTSLSSSKAKHRSPDCSFFELCVSVSVDVSTSLSSCEAKHRSPALDYLRQQIQVLHRETYREPLQFGYLKPPNGQSVHSEN